MYFVFRSCAGFGNALSFIEIQDVHIDQVQSLIKLELVKNIKNSKPEDVLGHFYKNDPERFVFMPGERVLIHKYVSHAKKMVDQHGFAYFKPLKLSSQTEIKNDLKKTENESNSEKYPYFLKNLLSTIDQNMNRKKGGYRYNSEIKHFAMYLRLVVGPLGYQTLQSNLEAALPSLSSTNRYIKASHYHITEGVLRSEELLNYLNERSLPKIVSISEDATRVVGRVQYDARTNQVIGFTLPINDKTGMPIPFAFPARHATEIFNHFTNGSVSGFLNIVMARPMEKNVSPFCLLLFGSNNMYTAMDVKNRWEYIEKELKKLGIMVMTWSSDSDPRYNSVMRGLSKLGTITNIKWFSCDINNSFPIFIQDTVHIITKMRNFLLRTKWQRKKLPFGNKTIDMMHLYVLLYKFSKDKHLLTESVLNPADRQNLASAERMCDGKVTDLLSYVEHSEATALYLKIMNDIMSAFMDPNLLPINRIRCMWFPVFMFRIWRQYVEKHKNYTLKDNFLTMNCYSCIELNAHGLVLLMVHLNDINRPELFLPELYQSQDCESTFRQLRSMSSTYSTVVNCTLKEAASRVSKIQLQYEIMHSNSQKFVFPRLKVNSDSINDNKLKLPSKHEIYSEIESCQRDAIIIAKKFGLVGERCTKKIACKIKPHTIKLGIPRKNQKKIESTPKTGNKITQLDLNNIKLKNYTGKLSEIDVDVYSPYVMILSDDGKETIVKKTSLCWLLRDDCRKLSSDRLMRVRHTARKPRVLVNKSKHQQKHKQQKQRKNNSQG